MESMERMGPHALEESFGSLDSNQISGARMTDGLTDMARDWNRERDRRRKQFYYQWNKEHGICVECGTEPCNEVTVRCIGCYEKDKERRNARN